MKINIILLVCLISNYPLFSQHKYKKKADSITFTKQHLLEPLEIKSIRNNFSSPFTFQNISKMVVEKNNIGQDIPYILNQTPSFISSSDGGTGIGYTNFSIRGSDKTRINVTLNGIPYNDAESMLVYFVDIPDFASSISSIQIQRGVGTSTNGASSFGASINLSTNEIIDSNFLQYNTQIGSFNTFKNTLVFNNKNLLPHLIINGRVSLINSDGYVQRAYSNLKSFYISGAYLLKNGSLKLNILNGNEKTYQAWNGITAEQLQTQRNYNSAGTEKLDQPYNNQIDNYTQTHYQLFYNQKINSFITFNTAFFITKGKGYFENYYANPTNSDYGIYEKILISNLVNQKWLDNTFYGQIFSLNILKPNSEYTVGGGWSIYDGQRFNKVIAVNESPYNNKNYFDTNALKKDAHIYGKWKYKLNKYLYSLIDFQYRIIDYKINGFEKNPQLFINNSFNFFNPKIGLSYVKNKFKIFASFAIANKEPNRDDFEIDISNQPLSEHLQDWEIGYAYHSNNLFFATTFYYMDYTNQLILSGKINDVGAYTRTNVPTSYRMGVEIEGSFYVFKSLKINGNLTISKNKINTFTEYVDIVKNNYTNTDIALSPNFIYSNNFEYTYKKLQLNLIQKFVSKQYLDNTQNENISLNAYFVHDLKCTYNLKFSFLKSIQVSTTILNIFNELYEPNGYTYKYIDNGLVQTINYYYPNAGTQFFIGLNVGF